MFGAVLPARLLLCTFCECTFDHGTEAKATLDPAICTTSSEWEAHLGDVLHDPARSVLSSDGCAPAWFNALRQATSTKSFHSGEGQMSPDQLTRGEKSRITRARGKLLAWFKVHGRDFPWRKPSASQYERICVEVLLQRTRAETVAGMYVAFFERYPDWPSLASATNEELEQALKPIGLWRRRAKSIGALATYASTYRGEFPSLERELAAVPAVGQYVANAIQLFQHDRRKPLVDVNMARFLERYLRPRRLADIRHDPWLQAACHWLVDCTDPISVNWAVLDHAAITCRARKPLCGTCIFRRTCSYSKHSIRAPC